MQKQAQSRYLWAAFAVLFAVVAVASFAPVEPRLGVVPLWAALVVGAMVATIAVGAGAVYSGWPETGGETA
jgi:lipopolysaccharide export LptBFGC system permease protein LptF